MHVPPSSTSSPGTPGWRRQTPCWASVKLSGRSADAIAAAVAKECLAGWQQRRWSAALQERNDGVRVRAVCRVATTRQPCPACPSCGGHFIPMHLTARLSDNCTNMTRWLPRSQCRRLHAGGRRTGAACSVHAFGITPCSSTISDDLGESTSAKLLHRHMVPSLSAP